METVIIKVDGMKCGGCSNTLRKALENMEGVSTAETSHTENSATVVFNQGETTIGNIYRAVEDAGFRVNENTG